jgi:hypothetical protein
MKTILLYFNLHSKGCAIRYDIKQNYVYDTGIDLYFDNKPSANISVFKALTLRYYSVPHTVPHLLFEHIIECKRAGARNKLYKYFNEI